MLLALSTSTESTSVAVGTAAAHTSRARDARAGDVLFALIDEALAAAGVAKRDLGAIACDVGPGSFTGVRVGVAAARALAFALGVPAVPVLSLRAAVEGEAGAAGVLLDAGRGEAYAGAWDGDRELVPPSFLAREAALELLRASGARIVEAARPSAARVLVIAERRLALGEALPELQPLYLRPPDITLPRRPPPERV